MSPSGVRQELGRRPSAGGAGNRPRTDACALCLSDIPLRHACGTGSTNSSSQQSRLCSHPLLGMDGGFAPPVPEKNVMYPRTELLHSKACAAGISTRRAGFDRRDDAECRQ
jgi:hypothetical protein